MKLEDYNNYKVGALKRKFKTGKEDQAPGTFISKMNETKQPKMAENLPANTKERTAILGMV